MSEQAVKIFEALSDVDEELLERCSRKADGKAGAVRRIYQRYGRAMAACLCLMAVGAAVWGGYSLTRGSSGDNDCGAAMDTAQMASSMAVADAGSSEGNGGAAEAEKEFGNGAAADGIQMGANPAPAAGTASAETTDLQAVQDMLGAERAEASKISGLTLPDTGSGADSAGSVNGNADQAEKYAELREREDALLDSREEIPWEEACAAEPFCSYLPTVLPGGYEAFSARRSTVPEQWNNLIFKWTDGGHIFFMNMTLGEAVTREDIERRDGMYEYVWEDFRKELMPDPPIGEPLAFTLYYADGMRIDFEGVITVDEMWEVVESIQE